MLTFHFNVINFMPLKSSKLFTKCSSSLLRYLTFLWKQLFTHNLRKWYARVKTDPWCLYISPCESVLSAQCTVREKTGGMHKIGQCPEKFYPTMPVEGFVGLIFLTKLLMATFDPLFFCLAVCFSFVYTPSTFNFRCSYLLFMVKNG